MTDSRCPKCGALYSMVGRAHRCVTKIAAGTGPATTEVSSVQAASLHKVKKGRPRLEDRDKTLKATKPWFDRGMSERTWYRRKAEEKKL